MKKSLVISLGAIVLVLISIVAYNRFSNRRFASMGVDKTFKIEIAFPDLAEEEFGDREKADQARDWLLYTIITNSGLKAKAIAEVSFDLAPVRYGYNTALSNFDYGDTRSKYIGSGEVVILIPASDKNQRIDNIAYALDETRKNQGEIPNKAYIFEYTLNIEAQLAKLTRRESVDAKEYFTEKMGYFQSTISRLDDFESFMSKIDDVIYAKRNYEGLVFGGRKLFGQSYGRAKTEDVAAIWQSQKYIQDNDIRKKLEDDKFDAEYREETNSLLADAAEELELMRFQDGVYYSDLDVSEKNEIVNHISKSYRNSSLDEPESEETELLNSGSAYKKDRNVNLLISGLKKKFEKLDYEFTEKAREFYKDQDTRVAYSSGFSLDPAVNFEESIDFVITNQYWFANALAPHFTVSQLINQLREKKGDLMHYAVAKIGTGIGGYLGVSQEAKKKCIYQKARYDGPLQGTEVGMTLFYTDLLAKIWSGNRYYSKPLDFIPQFKDHEQSYMTAAKVFDKESESLSAIRLWFGPNKNGFQSSQATSELMFSRNSTQIFALSNNPTEVSGMDSSGKNKNIEQQASAKLDLALSWWNNHFEEVAQFEKQYQRLNEIMKWSTIITWLDADLNSTSLSILDTYPVRHDLWFPDWAKNNKDLKFKEWDKVGFFPKGFLGDKTEAMPILYSPNGIMEGGVSLAEKSLIKEAPEILSVNKSLLRRANIATDYTGGKNAFKTFKETQISILDDAATKSVSINVKAKPGLKLRNNYGELKNGEFKWKIVGEKPGSFTSTSTLDDVPIGRLYSKKTGKNGFAIGFESYSMDKGLALAKQCSDQPNLKAFLQNNPQISRYFNAGNDQWCVQMQGSENWILMKIGNQSDDAATQLSAGWQARTSGNLPESKIVGVKWIPEHTAATLSRGPLPPAGKTSSAFQGPPAEFKAGLFERLGDDAANTEITRLRKAVIKEADGYALNKEYGKAASEIDNLIRYTGETPELITMKIQHNLNEGLRSLETGDVFEASRFVNKALGSRPSTIKQADILHEINELISRSEVSTATKSDLQKLAKAYLTDEKLAIPGHWEGYGPFAKKATLAEINANKGARIIYDYDLPVFNIDPAAPFETVFGQIRSIPEVYVYDITAKSVGRNTRMYTTLSPHITKDHRIFYSLQIHVSPGSATGNCNDDDDDNKQDCESPYSVNGPVYYITGRALASLN